MSSRLIPLVDLDQRDADSHTFFFYVSKSGDKKLIQTVLGKIMEKKIAQKDNIQTNDLKFTKDKVAYRGLDILSCESIEMRHEIELTIAMQHRNMLVQKLNLELARSKINRLKKRADVDQDENDYCRLISRQLTQLEQKISCLINLRDSNNLSKAPDHLFQLLSHTDDKISCILDWVNQDFDLVVPAIGEHEELIVKMALEEFENELCVPVDETTQTEKEKEPELTLSVKDRLKLMESLKELMEMLVGPNESSLLESLKNILLIVDPVQLDAVAYYDQDIEQSESTGIIGDIENYTKQIILILRMGLQRSKTFTRLIQDSLVQLKDDEYLDSNKSFPDLNDEYEFKSFNLQEKLQFLCSPIEHDDDDDVFGMNELFENVGYENLHLSSNKRPKSNEKRHAMFIR
jgi:hypothetical protein